MKHFLLILPVALLISACTSTTTSDTGSSTNSMTEQRATMAPTSAAMTSPTTAPAAAKDVVEIAVGSQDHTTLVAAVTAAGLVETLKGQGPFTVFAPTNAAFSALPAGTVDNLLKPESKADLTKVLTYHVVPGTYMAKDLKEGSKLKTVQGQELTFTQKGGSWYINDTSMISAADLTASNGVVHVINGVVLPK